MNTEQVKKEELQFGTIAFRDFLLEQRVGAEKAEQKRHKENEDNLTRGQKIRFVVWNSFKDKTDFFLKLKYVDKYLKKKIIDKAKDRFKISDETFKNVMRICIVHPDIKLPYSFRRTQPIFGETYLLKTPADINTRYGWEYDATLSRLIYGLSSIARYVRRKPGKPKKIVIQLAFDPHSRHTHEIQKFYDTHVNKIFKDIHHEVQIIKSGTSNPQFYFTTDNYGIRHFIEDAESFTIGKKADNSKTLVIDCLENEAGGISHHDRVHFLFDTDVTERKLDKWTFDGMSIVIYDWDHNNIGEHMLRTEEEDSRARELGRDKECVHENRIKFIKICAKELAEVRPTTFDDYHNYNRQSLYHKRRQLSILDEWENKQLQFSSKFVNAVRDICRVDGTVTRADDTLSVSLVEIKIRHPYFNRLLDTPTLKSVRKKL